jgi:hypothetical protein
LGEKSAVFLSQFAPQQLGENFGIYSLRQIRAQNINFQWVVKISECYIQNPLARAQHDKLSTILQRKIIQPST